MKGGMSVNGTALPAPFRPHPRLTRPRAYSAGAATPQSCPVIQGELHELDFKRYERECSANLFGFARVEGRSVVAAFDGGKITSDAGGVLLRATDRAIGLIDRFAQCFSDSRSEELIEHTVATMIGQRVFGIALGWEDVVDHDTLRHDPIVAVLAGKLTARRKNCAPVAGKSTLNRLELGKAEPTPYHKIGHDPLAIEGVFVDLFLAAQRVRQQSLATVLRKQRQRARLQCPLLHDGD
jgi:hypothetical protein